MVTYVIHSATTVIIKVTIHLSLKRIFEITGRNDKRKYECMREANQKFRSSAPTMLTLIGHSVFRYIFPPRGAGDPGLQQARSGRDAHCSLSSGDAVIMARAYLNVSFWEILWESL